MAGGTVTISGGNVIHTFTSSGYLTPLKLVNNSLRFRTSASAYLSRTGTTATNGKTCTYSFWLKRGVITASGVANWIFTGGASSNVSLIGFNASADTLSIFGTDTAAEGNITTAVFRDPAAWYHFVIAINTAEGAAADRAKIYVNGVQQAVSTQNGGIVLNSTWGFNTANVLNIGRYYLGSGYFDGYLTEVNFIDGQTLTPSSFGSYNSYGVWQPITYGGSYGKNGFYLPMTLSSSSVSTSFLVVAGGGGGAAGNSSVGGGGGGAGGLIASSATLNVGTTYTVTVGSGGTGGPTGVNPSTRGGSGGNSVLSGTGLTTQTAVGGGGGGAYNTLTSGASGGSGGGGAYSLSAGGTGTVGQGNDGGTGGSGNGAAGGGGSSAVGSNASGNAGGNGGAGTSSSISGSAVTYAGGGGGGGSSTAGTGGSGGGGAGSISGAGTAGTAGLGGGGGGSGGTTTGSAGGSGVVIVSYSGSTPKFSGGAITYSGGNTIHTFLASGTLSPVIVDYSPQGNNWTPNNISFSSGSTYDSMTDVPTLTSTTVANYCVVNPLMFRLSNTPGATISNGNLTSTHTPTAYGSYVWGTVGVSSGKWYWEITATTVAGSNGFGIDTGGMQNSSTAGAIWYLQNGTKTVFGSSSAYGASWTSGDVIGVALDMTAGTLTYYKNNTSQGVAATGLTGTFLPFALGESSAVFNWNFGQQPFAYTAPSGFLALNTYNI